jgi:hypothetical protein
VPRRSEEVIFNGITFRRYPDSKAWADCWYYTPNGRYRLQGVGRLHQEIWKAAHGPIPAGFEIHHVDRNPLNNSLDNLEAIHPHAHRAIHEPDWVTNQRERSFTPKAQVLANAWHRSPEGRAWHSQHGKDAWGKRQPIERVCQQCGTSYSSITRRDTRDRFCSPACKSKWRRKALLDDTAVVCPICGVSFQTNVYRGSETCSRRCGAFLREQRKRSH